MKSLNELIDPHLGAAVDLPAQPWVQGLRDGVNNDPYWALILSALDSYGRSGRFPLPRPVGRAAATLAITPRRLGPARAGHLE